MRTNQLMLYKNMEHGKLLQDMTFLMENCENDYYNKEDLVSLLFDCMNELLEMTASHGFEGNLWHNYLTFLLANDENAYSTACEVVGAVDGSINDVALHDLQIFRELFEYGKQRAAVVGKENVYDFSIGNPSVPAPQPVTDAFRALTAQEDTLTIHSYTPAGGNPDARKAVADNLAMRTGMLVRPENIFFTASHSHNCPALSGHDQAEKYGAFLLDTMVEAAKKALEDRAPAVTMAAKSQLRNGRPVLIAVSTNDALGAAAENIGRLMGRKHYFFVPFRQDDPEKKPTSMVADFTRVPDTLEAALLGKQLQPVIL